MHLIRLQRLLVCPGCDQGYRPGRLAGYAADGSLLCATCLLGADPDDEAADHPPPPAPPVDDPAPAAPPALF